MLRREKSGNILKALKNPRKIGESLNSTTANGKSANQDLVMEIVMIEQS